VWSLRGRRWKRCSSNWAPEVDDSERDQLLSGVLIVITWPIIAISEVYSTLRTGVSEGFLWPFPVGTRLLGALRAIQNHLARGEALFV